MSAMDPDPATAPEVVRNYVLTRRRWLAVAYDQERAGDPVWGEYARSSEAMKAELARRGGCWEVGGVAFVLDPRRGIAIVQLAEREDGTCESV